MGPFLTVHRKQNEMKNENCLAQWPLLYREKQRERERVRDSERGKSGFLENFVIIVQKVNNNFLNFKHFRNFILYLYT